VLILSRHRASDKGTVEALLRTPSIKKHVAKYGPKIDRLMSAWA
jgi:hypothetical protein